jgi:hypothetical protein
MPSSRSGTELLSNGLAKAYQYLSRKAYQYSLCRVRILHLNSVQRNRDAASRSKWYDTLPDCSLSMHHLPVQYREYTLRTTVVVYQKTKETTSMLIVLRRHVKIGPSREKDRSCVLWFYGVLIVLTKTPPIIDTTWYRYTGTTGIHSRLPHRFCGDVSILIIHQCRFQTLVVGF